MRSSHLLYSTSLYGQFSLYSCSFCYLPPKSTERLLLARLNWGQTISPPKGTRDLAVVQDSPASPGHDCQKLEADSTKLLAGSPIKLTFPSPEEGSPPAFLHVYPSPSGVLLVGFTSLPREWKQLLAENSSCSEERS